MQKEMTRFHSRAPEEVVRELDSDRGGLGKADAAERLKRYGLNEITEVKQTSLLIVFLRQFKSVMVYILLIAAAISFYFERGIDVYVILAVILVNAVIGFSQEYKAERAVKALKKMIVPHAKVYRNGELMQVPASHLVPGDVIMIEEGDRIPADARLLEIKNFRTVESSLTGESMPVDKDVRAMPDKTPFADRRNMVWLGTFVASGKAKAIVVATGQKTAIGALAKSIQSIEPKQTHFKKRTDTLAKHMAYIAGGGALITFIVGYFIRDLPFGEIILFAIASLVSGIPEGLPAVLAIVLAIGSYRMAKQNAVVREKYATETLGVIDTIITDKTGTLTENTMTVREILIPYEPAISVSGTGWESKGDFTQNGKNIAPLENIQLDRLLRIGALCNSARVIRDEGTKEFQILGDPTEAALVVVAEKAGLKRETLNDSEKILDDIPFNPVLKYHASLAVLSDKGKTREMYVVGAPEAVLEKATHFLKHGRKVKLTRDELKKINVGIEGMTNKAMRVLAIAYREVPSDKKDLHESDALDLIFIGVVGMLDPPRPEVRDAISRARTAGIRVIMATGDHKNTALAVGREIGLIDKNAKGMLALTDSELAELSEAEFEDAVKNVSVFARLTPDMKLKIAKTLQKHGHIVAMTGDGVNDAPALKQADVGVSMGVIGTDVAREASQMVLTDDNFASIINAVEEGRTVFINTRQTSFYLAIASVSEHATILATMFAGLPLPLLPTQILWLNLVTSGVVDVALSTEKSHGDVLKDKPRNPKENIINREFLPFLGIITGLTMILTLVFFIAYLPDETKARTAAFAVIAMTHLFNIYNMRSLRLSIFRIGFFSNWYITGAFFISLVALLLALYLPALQGVFGFVSLSLKDMLTITALSLSVIATSEIYKFVKRKKERFVGD